MKLLPAVSYYEFCTVHFLPGFLFIYLCMLPSDLSDLLVPFCPVSGHIAALKLKTRSPGTYLPLPYKNRSTEQGLFEKLVLSNARKELPDVLEMEVILPF